MLKGAILNKQVIEFKGTDYLLIGSLENGGAIATVEQYENFLPSYAHLKKDGSIWSYGKVIGSRHEIIVKDEYTPKSDGE